MKAPALVMILLGAALGQPPASEVSRLLSLGQSEQAAAAFSRELGVLEGGEARSAYLRAIFKVCEEAGALGEMRTWLQGDLQDGDGVMQYYLGFIQARLMLLERADQSLRAALQADPRSETLLSLLATIASRRQRHAEAARLASLAGPSCADLARREAHLEQELQAAGPRQWAGLGLGLVLLVGLVCAVRRQA